MNKLYKSIYHSPVGQIIIISNNQYLLKIYPEEIKFDSGSAVEEDAEPIRLAKLWLDAYFAGSKPSIDDLPIQTSGTDFQQKCRRLLCNIPYGSTRTYKDLAEEIANGSKTGRMSCQAVGQAIRKNPLLIIIPCHRVIGTNGSLTGYAGGLALKKELLIHEKALKSGL